MPKLLKKVLVIVLAGGKGERLEPLTRDRTKPAVPFGGIYRIIDFTLSNAINSHLRKIIVLVQYKCISLNRHLREGWNFLSTALGEYIEPISPQQRTGDHWYLGTADAVAQNIYSIEKEEPEYVLILAGDHIYKMDYNHILRFHRDTNADITVSTVEVPRQEASRYGTVEVDAQNRIIGFQEKPQVQECKPMPGHPEFCLASMGIYVFKTEVLYKLLKEDMEDPNSSHDFGRDIIPKAVRGQNSGKVNVFAFNFIDENKQGPKYWRDVGTIDAYYEASMDLISVSPLLNLYDKDWPIHTTQVQAPPPKFVFAEGHPAPTLAQEHNDKVNHPAKVGAGPREGIALDSIICQGGIISGGRVQNSILSPNVRVNSYASIYQSIIFEGVTVGRYARIRRAIIDKDVKIPDGSEIGYNLEQDRKRFVVSEGDVVVISKGAVL
ncbi:MAG: NTP transferase domain-containing protein [Planctomycetes bacterium]|nr:NTP transferase domain-containing protein [Planctomycetota bacterium]